ncbi:MAG TPA: hypothetical protein VIF60_11625 [Burkholderiaceae bacterium]|jgi:hypothetical protein
MKQEYEFADDRIPGKKLVINMGSTFTDPALFLDGEELDVRAGNCTVRAEDGTRLDVSFKNRFLDRYPSVILGGRVHVFVKPLFLIQKIALVLPFLFALTDGFVGLCTGIAMWIISGRMFRRNYSALVQVVLYVISLVTAYLAVLASELAVLYWVRHM